MLLLILLLSKLEYSLYGVDNDDDNDDSDVDGSSDDNGMDGVG